MNRNVQLRITSPCGEDWSAMRPEEKGRFCGACAKTVVDFSMMTDEEVIQFLGRAGQNVCGRFAEEQLERDFSLALEGRRRDSRGWRGWWGWLVAGLLLTAEARGQGPMKKAVVEKVDLSKPQELDTVRVVGFGVKGRIDVAGGPEMRPLAGAQAGEELYGTVGGLSMVAVRAYGIWRLAKDSLAAIGLTPKRELEIYPNPVRRGGTFTLNWQRSEPGTYEVSIFNASGALIEHRKIEVGGKEQIDLLSLPPALPAGMYFLRASRPGAAKVIITLRIIVV